MKFLISFLIKIFRLDCEFRTGKWCRLEDEPFSCGKYYRDCVCYQPRKL